MTKGRRHVNEIPRWFNSNCQTVQFDPLTFYPDKRVHVQVSVSHVNSTTQVHDAAVSWVENVNVNNFTFCAMESGRNEGPPHGFATVEYIAYQGAPSGDWQVYYQFQSGGQGRSAKMWTFQRGRFCQSQLCWSPRNIIDAV